MSRTPRLLAGALIVMALLIAPACYESGIGVGVGVPTSGARWGSGAAGPDVIVGGGPVYR